ncbi:fibronectin type III domain-containing protein [Dehalococcoidia bacterium]|nr:fibronectin type III domain-containing protein [Dehalococcoidia bacterium]
MKTTEVYRLGIRAMVALAVAAMVFAVFAGMNTQTARAEVFETNVRVSARGHDPDIAVDSAGIIHVVWEDISIYLAKSTDGGLTFGAAVEVSDTPLGTANPSIAVDADDNVHVAWAQDNYIKYAKSTDGGASFTTPVTVNDTRGENRRPDIASYGNNIYIVWHLWAEDEHNLYLDNSINGGDFGTDVRVNVGGRPLDPAIAIGTGETIYVAWEELLGFGRSNARIATSTDQGASFGASVKVSESEGVVQLSIAAIGTDTVYVTYNDWLAARSIQFAKSTNQGVSFSPPVDVSDVAGGGITGGFRSSIAVHPCGKIFVAWRDDRSGDGEIYFANSTDEGISFGTDVKVNDVPPPSLSDHREPSLAVGNDTEVYVVWRDMRTGSSQIYFAKAPDATWPNKITDLDAVDATATSITLNWTAPGDNFALRTAAEYDIRYSTSPITDANWAHAMQVSAPSPREGGSNETFEVTGLNHDTLYYFAIKTSDEIPNTSPLSNVVSMRTLDGVPPARVIDLTASEPTLDSIELTWTASGDDGNLGTATEYDIRYSTSPITGANWDDAVDVMRVAGELTPGAAGTTETFVVVDLQPGTKYYFAIKTADEVPNWSLLSNVASETTLINHPPDAPTLTEPATDTWVTTDKPTFAWTFRDPDIGDSQGGFYLQINDTLDWTAPAYHSGEIVSSISSYTPTTAISDGIWYWRVKTMDARDAWGYWSDVWVVMIDTVLPIIHVTGVIDGAYYNTSRVIDFSATDDNLDTVTATLNGTDFISGATVSEEDEHTLIVNATDLAGNVNATTIVFTIDNTPPTTNDNAPSGWQISKPVIVSLTPEADLSGIAHTYYKKWLTTENEPADYTEGTAITLDADGTWNIKYYSVDRAGNVETYEAKQVQIDTTSPTGVTLDEPTDVTESSVPLTWSKNTDPDFNRYEIYKDETLVDTITDRNTTTYKVTDLSSDTTYYFKVKVVDNAGLSTESIQRSATTSAPPEERMNWVLIGGIIVIIIAAIAVAVVLFKKKKGKTPQNP